MAECPDCHGPISECSDPKQPWYAQRRIDYKQMAQERAWRKYRRRHKDRAWHNGTFPEDLDDWAEEYSADTPFHFDDGVTITVSMTDDHPDDYFLGGRPQPEEVADGGTP